MQKQISANIDKVETGSSNHVLVRLQIAFVIAFTVFLSLGYGVAHASIGGQDGPDEGVVGSAAIFQPVPEENSLDGKDKLFIPAINADGSSNATGSDAQDVAAASSPCYSQNFAVPIDAGADLVPFARIRRPGETEFLVRSAYYFELKDSSQNVVGRVFCIQPFADLNPEEPSYCAGDGSAITGELAWLLNTYPPIDRVTQPTVAPGTAPGCVTAGALECTEQVQNVARQLAVWNKTSDHTEVRIDNPTTLPPPYDTAILAVYTAILTSIPNPVGSILNPLPGEYAPGNIDLVITPATATNMLPGGENHSFTVKLTKGTTPLVGKTINVTTDFGVLNQSSAPTDANGEATFIVSSNSAGTANLTAEATIQVPSPTNYVNPSNATRQQTASGGTKPVPIKKTAQKTWIETPKFKLGDRVWNDLNQNGVQEVNEPGVAGITASLYSNALCTELAVATTTTADGTGLDPKGFYQFAGLLAGDYCVKFTNLPSGWSISPKDSPADDTLDSDADTGGLIQNIHLVADDPNEDMGIYKVELPKFKLGDRVWYDLNQNGVQEANEAGVAGITAYLYSNPLCTEPSVATTMTADGTGGDPKGFYQFAGLLAGDYCVKFTNLPSGWSISPKDSPADDTLDSDADTGGLIQNIQLNADDPNEDMGIYMTGSLGDQVWCESPKYYDTDYDPDPSDGDIGLPDITLNLFEDTNCDSVADGQIASTFTDAFGFYTFGHLKVGLAGDSNNRACYVVKVDASDPQLGACKNPITPIESPSELTTVAPNDPTNDFGFISYDLTVEKTGPFTAKPGDMITYLYTVTNAGPEGTGVRPVIVDNLCAIGAPTGGDTNGNGRVDPGELWTYSCNYKVPATQACNSVIENVVTVDDADNPNPHQEPGFRGGDYNPTNNTDTWKVTIKCTVAQNCKDVQSKLVATDIVVAADGKTASATVTNNSSVYVDIGMASYRKFDEVIANQEIFDWMSVQLAPIPPNKTKTLTVKLPFNPAPPANSRAAAQIDLFCGPVNMSLNELLYGDRKLKYLHINGTNYALPLPPADSCPTNLGLDGIVANGTVQGKIKVKATLTGKASKVQFDLYNSSSQNVKSFTENIAPYCFMGDDGATCYDVDTSVYSPGDYSMKVTGFGTFGASLPVACDSIQIPFKIVKNTPAGPTGKTAGLNYKYYEGEWSQVPSYGSNYVKNGTVSNFTLAPKTRSDKFGFKFSGYIWISNPGSYTFYTTSDDGSILTIDGTKVVDNNGLHGSVEKSGTVTLVAGWHSIDVTYFDRDGSEVLEVRYKGPDTSGNKKLIPDNVLFR